MKKIFWSLLTATALLTSACGDDADDGGGNNGGNNGGDDGDPKTEKVVHTTLADGATLDMTYVEFTKNTLLLNFAEKSDQGDLMTSEVITPAISQYGDKLSVLNLFGGDDAFAIDQTATLKTKFDVNSLPAGVVDFKSPGYSTEQFGSGNHISNAMESAADGGLKMNSSISGGTLSVDVSIFAKNTGSYRLVVVMGENNLTDGGKSYNRVARTFWTDVAGLSVPMMQGVEKIHRFSWKLPEEYKNSDANLFLTAFLLKGDGSFVNCMSVNAGSRKDFSYTNEVPSVGAVTCEEIAGESTIDPEMAVFQRNLFLLGFASTFSTESPLIEEKAIATATTQYKKRVVSLLSYGTTWEYPDPLETPDHYTLKEEFNIAGIPSVLVNYQGTGHNPNDLSNGKAFAAAMEDIEADGGIAIRSSLNDDLLTAEVGVMVGLSGDYKLMVVLAESGIDEDQAGKQTGYKHDNVVRKFLTPTLGMDVRASGGVEKRYRFKWSMPAGFDKDNLNITAYLMDAEGVMVNIRRAEVGTNGVLQILEYNDGAFDKALFPENPKVPDGDIFRAILKQYEGRVVFVDVWGVGCGPCEDMVKHTKEFKKTLKGQPIAFIYISSYWYLKTEEAAWREYATANLPGYDYYRSTTAVSNSLRPEVPSYYTGVPFFILYDHKGNQLETGYGWERSDIPWFENAVTKALEAVE